MVNNDNMANAASEIKSLMLKNEILRQYDSIRAFAKASNIPHGTIVSALNHGIDGMAYERVIKMCDLLNIDYITFEPRRNDFMNLTKDENRLLAYYDRLSNEKKKKVIEYIKDIT